SPHNPISDVD
nr:Chain C, Smad1 peptide [Homo sapiens]